MRTTFNIKNSITMLSEMVYDSTFQVLEYDYLKGIPDIKYINETKCLIDLGIKLKQVRIILEDSAIKVKPGVLSYMKGSISYENKEIINPLANKLFKNKEKKEKYYLPVLKGSGEIFLDTSFRYFSLIELENEEIIIDEEIFYACEESIQVTAFIQKNAESIKNGEAGALNLKLRGEGIVVIELPVPEEEIIRCKIYKDKLVVNGEYVVLTTNNVRLAVEENPISYDEGLYNQLTNVYSGIGEIWLLPTLSGYNKLAELDSYKEIYHNENEDE